MSIKSILILSLSTYLAFSSGLFAASKSSSGSGSNQYMFIENNVDNEYFITPSSLSPRFSGANVWTRYSTNQRSLGYMGNSNWSESRYYFDLWISDSPIASPFLGIRCMTTGSSCPQSGYLPAEIIDHDGFYHTMSGNSVENGYYGAGTLSPEAYEYFRNKPVGSSDTFELNFCYTKTNYDATSGLRCKDLTTSDTKWRYYNMTLSKVGHLTLNGTNAMSEIWIASDGTPSVTPGSTLCQVGVVSGVNGVICKMVSYTLQQTERVTTSLDFQMVVDKNALGFTPSNTDIKYSGNSSSWKNYTSSTTYSDIFTTGGEYVYVFLSKNFFKKVVNAGKDLTNKDDLFTFYFDNSNTPQSGYYQFTPSSQINIIPKEYGISIISTDGTAHPKRSGKIGSTQPIEFEYRITTSASRQADSITVQVAGDSVNLNGTPYCLFKSTDGALQVPVPAWITFIDRAGASVKKRNSCADAPIDITDARWVQTAWNANIDDSFFFTTNVNLLFPMNDSRSHFTVSGEDWMGTVNASGEVKVSATWIGVNR